MSKIRITKINSDESVAFIQTKLILPYLYLNLRPNKHGQSWEKSYNLHTKAASCTMSAELMKVSALDSSQNERQDNEME